MKQFSEKCMLALGASLLAVGAAPAVAQGSDEAGNAEAADDREGQQIIVTASRREEELFDVEGSVTAFDEKFIEDRSIDSVLDLFALTPNITARNAEFFGDGTALTIRGGGGPTNTNAATGVYVDDIPVTIGIGATEPIIRTFDIRRVEVLRGPQGTLYGAGAMGGAVRYISNKPDSNNFEAAIKLDGSTTRRGGESFAVDGVINVPLAPEVAALRVTASYEDRAGFIDLPSSSDGNIEDSNTNELTSVRGTLRVTPTDRLTIDLTAWFQDTRSRGLNFVSANSNSLFVDDSRNIPLALADRQYQQYAAVITYEFGAVDLISSTSVFDITSAAQFAPFVPIEFDSDVGAFTHETRLVSVGDGPLVWNAGVFYQNSKEDTVFVTPFSTTETERDREQISVFGELGYNLTEDFAATVGLRVFEEDFSQVRRMFQGESDESEIAPKFVLNYTGLDGVNIYASASRGFRVGGVNNVPAGAGLQETFGSDSLWSYEGGIKFKTADSAVSGSVSAFYIDWSDIQLFEFNPALGVSLVINAGAASIKGIEGELNFNITDTLSIGANGSLLDATIDETVAAARVTEGDRLPFTAEKSFAVFVNYRAPLSFLDGWDFKANADLSYVGDQVSRNQSIFRDDALVGNARIAIASDTYEMALYARNFGDNTTLTIFSPFDFGVPRPRTIGLELIGRF